MRAIYKISPLIRFQVPNSWGVKLRVTININIKLVKIVTIPVMKKRKPEYVTRISDIFNVV
ncbi:hypothetical protein [Nitrosarchaeum sp. AC2]|uniref:hypothetical protein n=1 Tax=Nitrosarchaeum sp. AC2 TaxID=2259673 RepID=UPI0015CA8834|nr:hypothetical protein [Nitrosarchaeum sp. AC2]QLH10209.1 hypothetical protein DSQ20_00820 [Nitrosarchaeum sp. AC2]